MSTTNSKARIIKANYLLQSKVGSGPFDPGIIEKSQKLIDDNDVDFTPLAGDYIKSLEASIENARKNNKDGSAILQDMIEPVMQLKANARMFDYALIGTLSNIILNFLEAIDDIDEDVIEIVEAHRKMMVLVVNNQMKGDGGEYGAALATELKEACKRYFSKQAEAGNVIEDQNAFFAES